MGMADEPRDRQSMGRSRSLTPTVGGFGYSFGYGQQPNGAGWFGPLVPMQPVAPPDVKGRILDYPVGYNLNIRPRAYEPVTFQMLRNFADSYDLLRLVIETRKDQLGRMDWNIAPRDYVPKEQIEGLKAKALEIEKFFIRPDKKNFWDEWLRMLLEDLFVIDAPAIYRRKTYGGDLYALQLLDGATIKRIIDDYGNTPEPPDPAYQQILHGLPAVDYTTQDLLYRPRNNRTHKVYGFSHVEQIIMTVQIALRRQVWQLQSFTEGNIPEALIGTPMTWTPDQIRQFQDWFDAQLQGNTGERRRARFVPGEVAKSYVPTKEGDLFGLAEEWLARVVCFCFSISPQPFVKMMNRATAETAQETAVEEGLAPIQNYIKNVMDTIIIEDFGTEDLEFQWADEDELDPNIRSQIDDRERANGGKTFNEVRIANGDDPIEHPDADRPMYRKGDGSWDYLFLTAEEQAERDAMAQALVDAGAGADEGGDASGDTSPGPDDGSDNGGDTKGDDKGGSKDAKPAAKKAKKPAEVAKISAVPFVQGHAHCGSGPPKVELGKSDTATAHGKSFVNPDRKAATKAEKRVRHRLAAAFAKTGRAVASQVAQKLRGMGVHKADDQIDIDEILNGLRIDFDADLSADLAEELSDIYRSSGAAGLAQLGVKLRGELVDQVNDRAVDWAEGNAADLVTAISDATRDMLRNTIAAGMQDNLSAEDIADNIAEGYAFSEERAMLIATTEIASANSEGALAGYEEAANEGISVKKSWLILDDACEDCQENADAGAIDLDEQFPTGDDAPPAHPNCRCVLVPEVEESGDMGGEEAEEAEADIESEG